MHITLIPSGEDFNNKNATAVIHTLELARNLSSKCSVNIIGFSSHVNKFSADNSSNDVIEDYLLIHKNKLFHLAYKYIFLPIIYLYKFHKYKPDNIYARYGSLSIQSLVAAKILRLNYISEVNGFKISEEFSSNNNNLKIVLLKFYEKLIYSFSSKIISVSDGIRDQIIKAYKINPNKIITVNNGANTYNFKPLKIDKDKLKIPKDKFIIGFVGNITKWQGMHYLIRSAPNVIKHFNNINFVIVGDGSYIDFCKILVNRLNIEKYFIFTGRVDYSLVPEYINAFDVGVAPFVKERCASPIKIFEYMACAKPIISSNIVDVKNLYRSNEYITFFEANNSHDLSNKIIYSINNIKKLNNKAEFGREILQKNYTWNITAEKILNIIRVL